MFDLLHHHNFFSFLIDFSHTESPPAYKHSFISDCYVMSLSSVEVLHIEVGISFYSFFDFLLAGML